MIPITTRRNNMPSHTRSEQKKKKSGKKASIKKIVKGRLMPDMKLKKKIKKK